MYMEDIIGKTFGKLHVLNLEYKKQTYVNGKKDGFKKYYACICACGCKTIVERSKLINGHTKSCGCLKKVSASKLNYVHGMEKTRLYHIWQGIKRRCLNPNDAGYKQLYGSKGITICEEWKNSPTAFINWALKNGYNDKLTIDRIDNSKGYSPDNCRWVTTKQQARNTTRNHLITYKGKTHCIAEWAEILGFSYGTLLQRIVKHKWTLKRAFTQPPRKRRK